MGQAGEDPVSQSLGSGTAEGPFPNDQEELPGVVHVLCAIATVADMVLEGGQQILFELVVEEQEKR
jgi:hypothetical protein